MPLIKPSSTKEKELANASSFSLKEREKIAAQLNENHPEFKDAFIAENVIRVPRGKNKFDIYVLNGNEILGSGSDCQIYKAYKVSDDRQITGSPIAVKFLARKLKKDEVFVEDEAKREAARLPTVEGLKRESAAFKRIEEPLGDYLSTTEGDYLLMPLYKGEKLSNGYIGLGGVRDRTLILHRGAVLLGATPRDQSDMMYQLGHQVKRMHDHKVMHGDVHPSNMLVSRDSHGKIAIQLIDLDQSREVSSKTEIIVSPEPIKMEFRIRPPEVFERRIGASADIYALGLSYLFILGHPDPFSKPNNSYVSKQWSDYKITLEPNSDHPVTDHRVTKYKKMLDENKTMSEQDRKTDLYKYQIKLVNEKFTEEYKEKLAYQQRKRLEIGELTSLPVEVDGIPLREMVTLFIANMLHEDPNQRPTIDEVNHFMIGVRVLISTPPPQLTNTDEESTKNKWKSELKNPDNFMKFKDQIELESKKLSLLLDHIENIGYRIDQQKGFVKKHLAKSDDRKQLEERLQNLAKQRRADPSLDPKTDYDIIIEYLKAEKRFIEGSLVDAKGNKDAIKSAKYKAVVEILNESASTKSENELKSTSNSSKVGYQHK